MLNSFSLSYFVCFVDIFVEVLVVCDGNITKQTNANANFVLTNLFRIYKIFALPFQANGSQLRPS